MNLIDEQDDHTTHQLSDVAEVKARVAEGRTVVLVDEEYGYRYWFWLVDWSHQDIEAWWRGLSTVEDMFFNPSARLSEYGGRCVAVDCEEAEELFMLLTERGLPYAHLHQDDDSWLSVEEQVIRVE